MILFTLYFLLVCYLIYRNNFFGIFSDSVLSKTFYLSAFVVKLSALAVFYIVYTKIYGSINYSDTYNFYHDSQIIYSVSEWNFKEFIKLIFGFQDDSEKSELFTKFIRFTSVWDEDKQEFMYNDNRLMLRFHALLHFISNHNYYVHALFSSLLAFLGINWIYKAFRNLFQGKEIILFSVWLLFPGVWFWTSALFKEGPALFGIGLIFISIQRVISERKYSIKNSAMFLMAFLMAFTFKQYTLVPVFCFSVLFCFIYYRLPLLNNKGIVYCLAIVISLIIGNLTLKSIKDKTIIESLAERQTVFVDMSHGGIFLLDSTRFIRLPYDTTQIIKTRYVNSEEEYVKIKAGATFIFWEHTHQQDTLICDNNRDTISEYRLYYIVPKANATIDVKPLDKSLIGLFKITPQVLMITLCRPLFFDARNAMDVLASLENLLILLSFALLIFYKIRYRKGSIWILYWLSMVLVIVMIIGITSPNIGAIERYRALVMPFVVMSALVLSRINDHAISNNIFKKAPLNKN